MTDIYSTHELRPMVRIAQPNLQFLTLAFFADIVEFDDEFITFDVKKSKRKLAPFVSPCTQGKPNRQQGSETKSIKPPYIKVKDNVKPCKGQRRAPGEAIGGALSAQQRFDIALSEVLADHAVQIDSRMEWMAAKVLQDGKFVADSEDMPAIEIDYGRDVALSSTDSTWEDPTTDAIGTIESASTDILNAVGAPATDVIMTGDAWELFRKNDDVKELLNQRHGGLDDLNLAPEVNGRSFYKGLLGSLRLWVYNDVYEEEDSNDLTTFLDPYTVIVVANGDRGLGGYRAYGAIQDVNNFTPTDIFTKMWEQEDPSAMCVLSQSAGIPIASRINATAKIDVTPAP